MPLGPFPFHLPVGPWQVHPHLVFEGLAYMVGFQLFLAARRRRGDGLDALCRGWLVAAAVSGAAVGAKLLYWTMDAAHASPLADPASFWGGKTVLGALIGGHLAVEAAKRRMGIVRRTGDLYALPIVAAIAVGRIGCFLSGLPDQTHGVATALPWGVDFGDGVMRHPTQLYEILFLAVLGTVIFLWQRRGAPAGGPWRLFFVGYAAWRLLVGAIQPMERVMGLGALQWAALGVVAWWAYGRWIDPAPLVENEPTPAHPSLPSPPHPEATHG